MEQETELKQWGEEGRDAVVASPRADTGSGFGSRGLSSLDT